MESNKFTWVPFYKELATALLRYKDNRTELVNWIYSDLSKVKAVSGNSLTNYLHMKDGSQIQDIDPFSVFGIFHRTKKWENRILLLEKFKKQFNLQSELPKEFNGVPSLMAMNSFFFRWEKDEMFDIIIRDQWILYEKVVKDEDISTAFNKVLENGMPQNSLTMCLFWINPDKYLALDQTNRTYLKKLGVDIGFKELDYTTYTNFLEHVRTKMENGELPYNSFMEISYAAWMTSKESNNTTEEPVNDVKESIKYWLYAPGENASKWDWCQQNNMMCIGWHEIGDLSKYNSLEEVRTDMRTVYNNPDTSFKNAGLAVWEFARIMKPGDIVIAKQGRSKIIGRGVITGNYVYDRSLGEYCNVRNVKWTHAGSWETPQDIAMKTLTDITKYPEYVKVLESLFAPEQGKQYWWLVANPKIWTLSDMKVGDVQDYTLYNDNGNPRRIFKNFQNAKTGDLVIGYEATPTKQIVALMEIHKQNDGKQIWFKKIESLGSPIEYSTFRHLPELENMEFFKNYTGSLFKLTEDEFNTLMEYIREDNPLPNNNTLEVYTKADFLKEVFISDKDFETLKSLLERKKNLILQGAPGVGKTFAAQRLAYAIMGEENKDHIEQVQFHQNYSYEDFMMGYKPNEDGGFELKTGVFYRFCKKAAADHDRKYFFIIDEINRGNLSKIFGELLMLIEDDYRDKKSIKLSYRDEMFTVPSNVYIIGMMNTADRSLAMIDYALRRRFTFFEMKPGFESDGFKKYIAGFGDSNLDNVVKAIVKLNETITDDPSLGSGFCIGHSYFCNLESKKLQLRNILDYEIIPMIEEYWFDDKNKFDEESKKLREALK